MPAGSFRSVAKTRFAVFELKWFINGLSYRVFNLCLIYVLRLQ